MWKGLPRTNTLPSLFRAFVNYVCKKFYNIGPLADIWDSRSENIFQNSSATAEEVTCNQFHKHFMLVTYGPTKIICAVIQPLGAGKTTYIVLAHFRFIWQAFLT